MEDFFRDRMRRLTPIFIQDIEGMPAADPDDVAAFGWRFFRAGTPAFRAAVLAMILALQGLCLLTRRRSVYSLSPEEADGFMRYLYSSRLSFLSAIPTVLGTLIYMGHYGRDDLQAHLGFDVRALREEAAGREVKR